MDSYLKMQCKDFAYFQIVINIREIVPNNFFKNAGNIFRGSLPPFDRMKILTDILF